MTEVTDHKLFDSRARFERQLVRRLHAHGARWVVLAGFMRILTSVFLEAFPDRVVNIHPSLLPAFPGVDAQRQALDYGVKVSGCSVHLVSEGVDAGPLLAQAAVPIEADDTRDRLADRILVREHELLVSTLQAIAEGRLSLDKSGGRTRAWLR
jgi:phosphoribosylglycinamide formyltransferase-1